MKFLTKQNIFSKSFLASAVVHGILISLMFVGSVNLPSQGDQPEQSEGKVQERKSVGDFLDAPEEIEVQIIERSVGKDGIQKAKKETPLRCDGNETYGGVGLSHHWDGTVREAPPQYPAYQAGVRTGDRVINTNELRGEPGTEVSIRVYRGYEYIEFRTKRAKICVSEKP